MGSTGRRLVASMAAVMALGACGDDPTNETSTGTDPGVTGPSGSEVHWGYEGHEGPPAWGSLSSEFEACEAGMEQSPVDIDPAAAEGSDLPDPVLDWPPSDLEIVNNGHTIQADVAAGSTSELNGRRYDLLQFHWHRPSEHTVGGDPFAMELHFVHADAAGDLAVLGVLLEVGDGNPLYDILWEAQPQVDGSTLLTGVDFRQLLPADLTTWVLPGSLTTPPCSEGVAWNVVTVPASISAEQVEAFLYDGNTRPVQPLNDRSIARDET